jgi:hypothetical protein
MDLEAYSRMLLPSIVSALAFGHLTIADHVRDTPILIFGVISLCLAAAFLAFWHSAKDYRVFLGMGFYFLIVALQQFWRYFAGVEHDWFFSDLNNPFLVITAALALQIKDWRWTWLLWPIYLFNLIFGWLPSMAFSRGWSLFVAQAAIAIFIVQAVRQNDSQLRLVAAGFALVVFDRCTVFETFRKVTSIPRFVEIGGWRWYLTTPIVVLMGIITLVVYVRDLVQDRKDKQRLAAEIEAARAVQQVLIPDQVHDVPGFHIESAYKPAGELGGDFFQIIPNSLGSTLVVLGDVSGKGLKAAMTVSLTVGMLRVLAGRISGPASLLAELNHRLQGRLQGGFVTCLVLRLDAGGRCVVSSAGHPAPFLNHFEIELPGSLPLGLISSAAYSETWVQLRPGDRFVLYTDGLVEARNYQGELFSFGRLQALLASGVDANQATEAAQKFGQDDDITVLTFTCDTCPGNSANNHESV